MKDSKDILPDTLYITMKVIDRARVNEPDFYAQFEDDLDHLNGSLRDLLDKLDAANAIEKKRIGYN